VAVSGNSAFNAGGVFGNGGTLNIADSTVSGNWTSGDVGGIRQDGGTANITNSTVSANQAAGIYAGNGATMNIRSSTIANNFSPNPGGGIIARGSGAVVNVKNTIVSNNSTTNCATDSGGTITSQGNNIDSANSCPFTPATDKPNTDPFLGVLANNGGQTNTHALPSVSPAIDTGDSDQPTDQRGVSRPQDGDNNGSTTDDIGAFEKEAAPPPPPGTAACADDIDNDGDKKIDYPNDKGCKSASDPDERNNK
jgi:hypothetical protein